MTIGQETVIKLARETGAETMRVLKKSHETMQIPERITNSSSQKHYKPPKWESARPGADDHRRYRSRGV